MALTHALVYDTLKPIPLSALPLQPLVSVLVPNYNYARFLDAAIGSVLDQDYSNFELIVCDDGSTDDSCDVCSRWVERDSRVRLVRKSNGGQATAINAAYQHSSGDIICLLDSDDTFLPEKLSTVVNAFRSQPQTGFVVHRVTRVDRKGRPRGLMPLMGELPSGWNGPFLLSNAGILPDLPPCSGLNIRREVAGAIFPIREDLGLFGDTPVMRMAPLMTSVLGLDTPLARWRQHGENDSKRGLSIHFIERTLKMYRDLWELQRAYLSRIDPALGDAFCPLDENYHVLTLQYVLARLKHDPSSRMYYDVLVRRENLKREPCVRRWFWRSSIWMPEPIFYSAVKILISQNSLKEMVGRIRSMALRQSCATGELSGNEDQQSA